MVDEGGGTEYANATSYDPFNKDVNQAQLIVSMKIYDALMALLTEMAPEKARDLDLLHSQGVVIGLGPQFSHFFQRQDEDR